MKFLEGYKTKIGIAVLVLIAALGYWFGVLDPVAAAALLGIAWTAFGLADKMSPDRFSSLVLGALDKAKEAQKGGSREP